MQSLVLPVAAMAMIAGCSSPGGSATTEPADARSPQAAASAATPPGGSGQALPPPQTTDGEPQSVAAQDPADNERYAGRWIGVEGTFMNVTPRGDGRFDIEMQYDLDHRAKVVGYSTGDGLAIPRGGELLVARPSNGDATGLKWLAGKTDCLTVKPGEGYCRA